MLFERVSRDIFDIVARVHPRNHKAGPEWFPAVRYTGLLYWQGIGARQQTTPDSQVGEPSTTGRSRSSRDFEYLQNDLPARRSRRWAKSLLDASAPMDF